MSLITASSKTAKSYPSQSNNYDPYNQKFLYHSFLRNTIDDNNYHMKNAYYKCQQAL